MRLSLARLFFLLAVFTSGSAHGKSSPIDLINRISIIAVAPGSSGGLAPVFPANALPAASFEVLLNSELHKADAESYFRDRARLLAASYHVHVFAAAEYRPGYAGRPGRPLAVLGPDASGSFRLDQAGLAAGQDYAWVVSVQVDSGRGGLTLWSMPLYFRLAPDAAHLPGQLAAADYHAMSKLLVLCGQQQRAQAAARITLNGLALYYNYASASDTFYCAPQDERGASPWPEAAPGGWPLPALLRLGDLAAEGLSLQRLLDTDTLPSGQRLHNLGQKVRETTAGLSGLRSDEAGAGALSRLDELGQRLLATDPGASASLLSELFITLDVVADSGTRSWPRSGLAGFPAYARGCVKRLEGIEEFSGLLQASMHPDDWELWSSSLRQMRAEFALLADDIERGRMNLNQLRGQIERIRQTGRPVYADNWRYVDSQTGMVDEQLAGRIGTGEIEQQRRLTRELYWYHLSRFTRMLVPDPAQ